MSNQNSNLYIFPNKKLLLLILLYLSLEFSCCTLKLAEWNVFGFLYSIVEDP